MHPGRASVTRVVHTGRLPLGTAYCALYVVLVELAFTYQTIVALSANSPKCILMLPAYLHSSFIGALPQIKKYVEQVEKSFL